MARPLPPSGLVAANNYYFEVTAGIASLPANTFQFHSIEGLSQTSGEISINDGYTNKKHKFSSGLQEFGDVTLTRAFNASTDDDWVNAWAWTSFNSCVRFDGKITKMHCGNQIFEIYLEGLRVKNIEYPTLSTESEERFDVRYTMSVSNMYLLSDGFNPFN